MKTHSQSQLTKNRIINALMHLLERKPYDEIKIVDITREAQIARLTFYRHFDTKDQVILLRGRQLFNQCLSEINTFKSAPTPENVLTLCFSYWQSDQHALHLYMDNHLLDLISIDFLNFIQETITLIPTLNNLTEVQRSFVVNGIMGVIRGWPQNS